MYFPQEKHDVEYKIKINGGSEIFVEFNKRESQNKRGVRNFKISINIGNEWKKKHKCLILILERVYIKSN